MKFTAQLIAEILKGTIEGNPDVEVSNVSKIEEGTPGTVAFLANPKYTEYIYSTHASIVIVNQDFKAEKPIQSTLIRVENAYQSFAMLLEAYQSSKPQKTGRESPVYIDSTAQLADDIYLGAFAYIGKNVKILSGAKIYPHTYIGDNVIIGEKSILYAGVKIYDECKIGNNVIIHAGTVIGSDGFGFAPKSDKNYQKVPQVGNVIVEDDVEIGANCTIDRATMGSTIVRRGVKLDNLIQVAHNVEIGENCVIAAQTGVAGSSKIGKECMFGGQVGIAGHLTIADGTKIAAQSGIAKNIMKVDSVLQGSPAFEIMPYQKSYVMFTKLPDLFKKINELERQINSLKQEKS